MIKIFAITFIVLALIPKSCEQDMKDIDIAGIIPAPKFVKVNADTFFLKTDLTIFTPSSKSNKPVVHALEKVLNQTNGFTLTWTTSTDVGADIILKLETKEDIGEEGYILSINSNRIEISANSSNGLFYGIQSLRQLLPIEIENSSQLEFPVPLRTMEIIDQPRFGWRGMHLDVSRHFRSKEEVMRYIDLIAMHKMNIFHWHLIDDQGWRIEIKKFPKLTEVGAWRVDREDELEWRYRKLQQPDEKATYGGFYSQEDIREVVKYAKDRYITVIPEIEMPAHVTCALAAYPELSCTGGPFTVPPGSVWPITDIYCAGKEEVFEFLEDVLLEVMELFPSEFIHIGGDEAFKQEWERCDDCQVRIKNEGLKDEAELQSYFLQRIEKYLNANNRKLIGWDEILEGGLSPNATVMSWRGEEGGIEAAKAGHDAVMSPVSHCYFDYYQANPANEPLAIGGYTTLKKVYSYEPIPDELNSSEAKHILGAQGNLWTEYMHTYDHVEYMAVPRMTALAEVVWSPQSHRNWGSFTRRIQSFFDRLDGAGHNYSLGSYDVVIKPRFDKKLGKVIVRLESEQFSPNIKYTIDGSPPTTVSNTYTKPFAIDSSSFVRAGQVINKGLTDRTTDEHIIIHKGLGKPVSYTFPYHKKYSADGNYSLINGIKGSDYFNDEKWQGFQGFNMEAIVDLENEMEISKISVRFLSRISSWIFQPISVTISVSIDGKEFITIKEYENTLSEDTENDKISSYTYDGESMSARYIKVIGENIEKCPDWHKGSGNKAWVFADEIVIE
ncbi:MAG: family 20 glycosylhydrolase [Candidatus Marinimicrobia bacterium]|nr:family 20 glycosylhydrolase [Candidatus Neomarinimicrobiota bacterium]